MFLLWMCRVLANIINNIIGHTKLVGRHSVFVGLLSESATLDLYNTELVPFHVGRVNLREVAAPHIPPPPPPQPAQ
jgi:hypothetical protein